MNIYRYSEWHMAIITWTRVPHTAQVILLTSKLLQSTSHQVTSLCTAFTGTTFLTECRREEISSEASPTSPDPTDPSDSGQTFIMTENKYCVKTTFTPTIIFWINATVIMTLIFLGCSQLLYDSVGHHDKWNVKKLQTGYLMRRESKCLEIPQRFHSHYV